MKHREIKFRAWHKFEKAMCEVAGIHFGIGLIGLYDPDIEDDLEKVVLMQFTGLTDKNGVEIYEGDYLVDRWVDDEDEDQEALLPVVWDHENMQWCVDASFSKDGSYMIGIKEYFRFQDLEVRGNIFEKGAYLELESAKQ